MAIQVGSKVKVKIGTNDALKERGWIADYMTSSVDGMIGEIVEDHTHLVITPHFGVDLGFSQLVGIPATWLELVTPQAIKLNVNNFVRVRLTKRGKRLLAEAFEMFAAHTPRIREITSTFEKPEDSEGYQLWQMHELMSQLGFACSCGGEPPFEPVMFLEVE